MDLFYRASLRGGSVRPVGQAQSHGIRSTAVGVRRTKVTEWAPCQDIKETTVMKLFSRSSAERPGKRRGLGRLALSVGLLLPLAASFGALSAAVLSTSPASASIPLPEINGTLYQPVVPDRITDTRANSGYPNAGNTLTAGRTLSVQVTGIGSVSAADFVPLGAFAVVVNITAINPTANGYLTAYAAGQTLPFASTVNFLAGQTIANEATITLGNAGFLNPGYINIYNYQGTTDVAVDVQGYYTSSTAPEALIPGFYYPISYLSPVTGAIDNAPVRVLDTRPGSGQQGAGSTIGPDQQITFYPGTSTFAPSQTLVPLNATAVVLNVTEATNTASSFLTVWATGAGQPVASDLNWQAGAGPIANRVIVPYNPLTQSVSILNWAGSTDVVADLDGYFAPESEVPGLGNFEPTGCPILITQTLTVTPPPAVNAAGGTFTLTYTPLIGPPVTTAPISDTASASAVKSALGAIGYPVVSVTGSALPSPLVISSTTVFPLTVTDSTTPVASVVIGPLSPNFTGSCPGFFAGSVYYGLTAPARIADTRAQTTVPYALSTLGALDILDILVPPDAFPPSTGAFAPSGFDGVDINATVTDTTAPSYLEIFPAEGGFGLTTTQLTGHPASDINWTAGEIISNGDLVAEVSDVPLPSIDVFNWAGNVDVIIDVYGYFALDPVVP